MAVAGGKTEKYESKDPGLTPLVGNMLRNQQNIKPQ